MLKPFTTLLKQDKSTGQLLSPKEFKGFFKKEKKLNKSETEGLLSQVQSEVIKMNATPVPL